MKCKNCDSQLHIKHSDKPNCVIILADHNYSIYFHPKCDKCGFTNTVVFDNCLVLEAYKNEA